MDEILGQAGYRQDAPTSVQIMALAAVEQPGRRAALSETLTDRWLDSFCGLSKIAGGNKSTLRQMLGGRILRRCFAAILDGDREVACGLGVVQQPYIALFDIITDPDHRNRGYGRQIVLNLLDWGRHNGADTGYLQVMLDNAPALRLYDKMGFKEIYRYWYRIK